MRLHRVRLVQISCNETSIGLRSVNLEDEELLTYFLFMQGFIEMKTVLRNSPISSIYKYKLIFLPELSPATRLLRLTILNNLTEVHPTVSNDVHGYN